MRVFFLLYLALSGCGHVSRQQEVLRAEVKWFGKVSEKLSTRLLEQAKLSLVDGNVEKCKHLAEDALIVRARAPWHVQMALYLSRVEGVAPPDPDAPVVPTLDSYCEKSK